MAHSALAIRRLKDGRDAMDLTAPEDLQGLIDYRNQLHDGIAALQSLDDLGSEDANKDAYENMLELQQRYNEASKRIDELK